MLKALGVLTALAILVMATIGLAGGGAPWMRYLGASVVMFLLVGTFAMVSTQTNAPRPPDNDEEVDEDGSGDGTVLVEDHTDGQQAWRN